MIKILYIYSGSRKDKFEGKIGKDYPDTQFYGLNHLNKFGIEAKYKEPSNLLKKIFGFRIAHMFLFFYSFKYDIVFGPSLIYMLFWKKIFRIKAKYVLLNISLNRTISANDNKKLKTKILKWLLGELTAIICLSNFQKEYLEKTAPYLKNKIFFSPLGIDTLYYAPVYDNRGNFILSVGRDNGRDYKTVIETARLMPEEKFHIVASKRNFEGIKDIPKNIELFFDISFSELKEKYKKAKIFLLITKNDNYLDGADCSGQTSLLDAMASGLPVIASRKKYLADYMKDKKEGILVDFYDTFGIKSAIEFLVNNDIFRKNMARKARQKVENYFSTPKMAENLSRIFFDIYE